MGKSPEMEAALEHIGKALFGEDTTRKPVAYEDQDGQMNAVTGPFDPTEQKATLFKCPFCKATINPETDFRDTLSMREFTISRLCQKCQDKMFGDE